MCYRSKSRVIYYNPKISSCFTTFHPYGLRFSCYTLGKKIRGLRTALRRKEGITGRLPGGVSVAESSAVLLKNEKGVLPLAKGCKAVFLGEFAEHPRYQGGGSSHVNSAKVTCALEHAPGVVYAQGYRTDEDTVDPALEQASVATAADADGATGKKDDDASSMSMMMGIQLNTLIDFHVLTEEQLNGILSQINQA